MLTTNLISFTVNILEVVPFSNLRPYLIALAELTNRVFPLKSNATLHFGPNPVRATQPAGCEAYTSSIFLIFWKLCRFQTFTSTAEAQVTKVYFPRNFNVSFDYMHVLDRGRTSCMLPST